MGLYPYADKYPVVRAFPQQGRPRADVLTEIDEMAEVEDSPYHEGRISGSIYSGDEEHYAFLNDVFGYFSHANVLQRDMYPSATRFEGEIIAMTADMLHAPEPIGVLTSGGTESLMNPLLVYREWGRERGITQPNVVLPTSAHPAFHKGAHYFGIELRLAPVTDQFVADVAAMRDLVDENTVALLATAGTYPHGAIDPIGELSDLALERGINLHVDGCLGGFILAWGEDLGVPVPVFDFRQPGVTSMSADTHKYGFGLKGSSVLLYRTAELRRHQYFIVPDWPGGLYTSPGMSGSRSGGIIAAAWAAMVTLGRDGYLAIAKDIFGTAAALRAAIEAIPELRVLGDPLFNVAFTTTDDSGLDIFLVNDFLASRRWRMNGLQKPAALHFCVTRPNTQPGVVDRFAKDLAEAVEHARAHRGDAARSGAFYAGNVTREQIEAGMSWWLDATQAVPSDQVSA
ncbi:MAG TPA: aminotransferase class V-fold PLP-dependent enzyme [Ilumatobacteraceae bacterium]|nr:aminotransferase class V-fold PLP-dependent enzyme [Ilumatobacteraceae bacterium]